MTKQTVTTRAELDVLPVGSIIAFHDDALTKDASDAFPWNGYDESFNSAVLAQDAPFDVLREGWYDQENRVIVTGADELDALPTGSIIATANSVALVKSNSDWFGPYNAWLDSRTIAKDGRTHVVLRRGWSST